MKEFTIGEVARRIGIQTSAIRYYEQVGLLPPPNRVNGRRRYDATVFQQLGLIQFARQAGFGIRELQVLFAQETDWQTLATEKIVEMEAVIERAQAVKMWLTESLQQGCTGNCVVVTFDNAEQISLSCSKTDVKPLPAIDGVA